jgi:hypothetical protein
MLAESDDRRDDLSADVNADQGLEPADELDPMDADTYDASAANSDDDGAGESDTEYDTDYDSEDDTDYDSEDDNESDADLDTDLDTDTSSAEVPYEPLDATPETPTPPVTGDETVDDAMLRLAQSQAGSFAERIDAGEQAHHSLQSRLGGLGGA